MLVNESNILFWLKCVENEYHFLYSFSLFVYFWKVWNSKIGDALRIAQDKVNPKNYYAYNPEFDGAWRVRQLNIVQTLFTPQKFPASVKRDVLSGEITKSRIGQENSITDSKSVMEFLCQYGFWLDNS